MAQASTPIIVSRLNSKHVLHGKLMPLHLGMLNVALEYINALRFFRVISQKAAIALSSVRHVATFRLRGCNPVRNCSCCGWSNY
jgi:hypothetical protein